MMTFFKLMCLVLYTLGLGGVFGMLPPSWHIVVSIAGAVLAAHVIELIIMFKHVRRYQGSLIISILLTLLFGFLHWKPIADHETTAAI